MEGILRAEDAFKQLVRAAASDEAREKAAASAQRRRLLELRADRRRNALREDEVKKAEARNRLQQAERVQRRERMQRLAQNRHRREARQTAEAASRGTRDPADATPSVASSGWSSDSGASDTAASSLCTHQNGPTASGPQQDSLACTSVDGLWQHIRTSRAANPLPTPAAVPGSARPPPPPLQRSTREMRVKNSFNVAVDREHRAAVQLDRLLGSGRGMVPEDETVEDGDFLGWTGSSMHRHDPRAGKQFQALARSTSRAPASLPGEAAGVGVSSESATPPHVRATPPSRDEADGWHPDGATARVNNGCLEDRPPRRPAWEPLAFGVLHEIGTKELHVSGSRRRGFAGRSGRAIGGLTSWRAPTDDPVSLQPAAGLDA